MPTAGFGAVRNGFDVSVGMFPLAAIAPLGFGVAASVATVVGGTLGLRFADRIGLVLGLTAGIVIGVALFDLLPEAATLNGGGAGGLRRVVGWLAVGFGAYMLFRRAIGQVGRTDIGIHLAPALLTLHSFMDGLGIGLGFQVSPAVGGLVAAAVLTHDLADGVNIVSLCLAAGRRAAARRWLAINGVAPMAGVLIGLLVRVPETVLAPVMAAFSGSFLFIGACELVPRGHALDPRLRTTIASALGMGLMFVVTALAR